MTSLLVVDKDSIHYYLTVQPLQFFVKDDTSTVRLDIKSYTDSSMQLHAAADSLFITLNGDNLFFTVAAICNSLLTAS